MKPKPFRIFRVGTHTDSAGQKTTFTRDQLEATVQAYNEGQWRAPMVVGHPKGTAPAYGWCAKMRIDDDGEVWVDDVEKLNPDFAELMENGAYRNRSASWYSPDHPSNPTPGVWQLRHLGFLGAQPPALKALGDIEFHDQDGVTLNFADEADDQWSLASMWRSIVSLARAAREAIIAKDGIEAADKLVPAWQIDDAVSQMARHEERARQASTSPSFSENDTTEESTMTPQEEQQLRADAAKAVELQTKLEAAEAAKAAAEAKVTSFAEQQAQAAKAVVLVDAKAKLEPLVKAGKLLPNQLDAAADFMASLDDQAKVIEFGEAIGENKLTARAFVMSLLTAQPKQIEYDEVTGDETTTLPSTMTSQELADKAVEYQEAKKARGISVTSTQAVNAVLAGAKA